jgi:MFS family permease
MHLAVKRALEAIGNKHRYQWIVFFILFMLNAFVNLMVVGPTLIYMNPLFKCEGYTDLQDESVACGIIDQCIDSKHHDSSDSQFTIVGELKLYCDKQVDRGVIQAIFSAGSVVGMLVVNYISDKMGRRIALIIVQIAGIIGFGGINFH